MIKEYFNFFKEYFKLAELKVFYVFINFLTAIFYKGFAIVLPLLASFIIKYLTLQDAMMTYLSLLAFVVVYLLYNLTLYGNYVIYGYNMNYCYNNLTDKVLHKLIGVDHNFSRVISKGRLMNCINSDIIEIGDMCDQIAEFFMGILQIIVVLVIVGFINIYLTILLLLFTILYIWVRNRADRNVGYYHKRVQIQDDRYSNLLTQIIAGLQEIKTFNMLEKLNAKLDVIQNRFNKMYSKKRYYYTVRDNDVGTIVYICRFLLYMICILLIVIGRIDISIMILVVSYHEYLVEFIGDFINASATIRNANIAVKRINDILDYNSQDILYGTLDTKDIYGAISFKNVSLTLQKKEVLHHIHLRIDHNEVVAIVGETGSGKTMLFNLLLRLYKPNKGEILIDNKDIYSFSKETYPHLISIANQKPFIFNMSIRRNLNFVDRNIKHQIEACKKAGIHDFIETLPNGYNTILRENGSNISGGQKQMISIARTILSQSEIILLDDITTSLDPDTAKCVPKLIDNLKKDHTIVMITKKPDLMKIADRIVVMDKGRIRNVGTHNELMKTDEIYQTLQSRKSPSKLGVFDYD